MKNIEILVVEDSPTQAEQVKHIIEQHDYQVTLAQNGAQALDLIKKSKPSLVISDIVMPVMDGYQLCCEIKSGDNLKEIPVLLLTSLSDPRDIVRGLKCGADNFITKPFNEEILISRIKYMLNNKNLRKDERVQPGVEIAFGDETYLVTPERQQILDMLISSYEVAVQKNLELIKAQEELRELNENLEDKVEERTTDLMAEMAERKQAEEAIARLNETLEQRVVERTEQLKAANKELEAFSYSVSHDLRAPLRAVDGFSRILLEDYADKLDDEGRRVIDVICKNAINMGQLIDDLLAFSRLGRKQVETSVIDMNELARDVYTQLETNFRLHPNKLKIQQLPPATGDRALLRQVFINLLSNAVKYSNTNDNPIIEVGGYTENDEIIYYVKDNGVGFDMKYADKLFGVFQRLHSAEEFEGTGVGLAIVHRIIHRHGGRVWAEAEVGKGATFCFALPRNDSNSKELSSEHE